MEGTPGSEFNFDEEVTKVLPPSQDTLWALYGQMKRVSLAEDGLDLCGEQLVVNGYDYQTFQIRLHPFPERDSQTRMYRAATLSQEVEEATHELWCSFDNQTFELRGPAASEYTAQQLLGYFAPPESEAA